MTEQTYHDDLIDVVAHIIGRETYNHAAGRLTRFYNKLHPCNGILTSKNPAPAMSLHLFGIEVDR